MPDAVKDHREIKGDDMDIVIRLKNVGQLVKKRYNVCNSISSETKNFIISH